MGDRAGQAAEPTAARSMASAAYRRLREEIITGGLPPGAKLHIRQLCDRLGHGLSPVREALNRLASEGLVAHTDQRGFTVAGLDLEDLADLTAARVQLNQVALRAAIERGDAGWEELEDGVIVASQPHGAPSWFPCNDRASDKASYSFTVSAPNDYMVVANGLQLSSHRAASATTWIYEQQQPMAPYLATLQIGRYVARDLDADVPMQVVVPPHRVQAAASAFADQPEMLRAFQEWFGPYPYDGYRAVVTDDVLEIPLEAQTLSVFGSNFLTRDWSAQRLIAHELAHQWFGNSLTAAAWKDIWLHEGFACYSEWLWSEHAGVGTTDEHARHYHDKLAGLPQDLVLGDPGPEDMFDDRVYKRGALTLHALRREIGDDRFFDTLREWTRTFAHGSVTTADFVAVAERVGGRRLQDLLDSWLYELRLPRL